MARTVLLPGMLVAGAATIVLLAIMGCSFLMVCPLLVLWAVGSGMVVAATDSTDVWECARGAVTASSTVVVAVTKGPLCAFSELLSPLARKLSALLLSGLGLWYEYHASVTSPYLLIDFVPLADEVPLLTPV